MIQYKAILFNLAFLCVLSREKSPKRMLSGEITNDTRLTVLSRSVDTVLYYWNRLNLDRFIPTNLVYPNVYSKWLEEQSLMAATSDTVLSHKWSRDKVKYVLNPGWDSIEMPIYYNLTISQQYDIIQLLPYGVLVFPQWHSIAIYSQLTDVYNYINEIVQEVLGDEETKEATS